MLKVKNVSRSYGQFKAVDNVSFSIDAGEVVGLLGHNGAGKTTIMRMLSGSIEPDSGGIEVNSLDLMEHPKLIQRSLGYLPENLPVYPEMTVAEYLDYAASLKGLDDLQRRKEIQRCIQKTDLADKFSARIQTLSRGYRQRVGVAQALLGRPGLLILDEPTNGLDPAQTEQMRKMIRALAADATVILSTHIMQEVEAVCDRVLMVHQGRLVVDERLDALTRSNVLLLDTEGAAAEISALVNETPGVKSLEEKPAAEGRKHFRIEIDSADRVSHVAAEIARKLVRSNFPLYALHPEKRNLETLFAELGAQSTSESETEESYAA